MLRLVVACGKNIFFVLFYNFVYSFFRFFFTKIILIIFISALGLVTISANLTAGNLLDFDSDKVKKYVDENLTDRAREVWNANGIDSDEEIANKIAQNVDTMVSNSKPENWAPSRDSMPQPGVSGSDNWEAGMKKGRVNLISPKTSDVQESAKREKMKHMSNYRDFIKGKK
jgi:hypothetical protein